MGCMGSTVSGAQGGVAASVSNKSPAKRYSNADLTDKQILTLETRNVSGMGEVKTEAVELRFAWATQRGHYPDEPNKQNQDSCIALPQLGDFTDMSFFGVFDGHGKDGHLCSRYTRDNLHKNIVELLKNEPPGSYDFEDVLTKAHLATNSGLRKDNSIDDTLSGTTSVSLLLYGNTMIFSNLGDSRAVLVSKSGGRLVAKAMSSDQTPYRKDERERVKKYGARILTMEQIEGSAPIHENWDDLELGNEIDEGGDPPRIWSPLGDYPGTAFTRSIGDFFAESLGVVADPEFTIVPLTENDQYVIIASDGVFEFLTNQMTADMITSHDDILSVCRAVVETAYSLWLQYEYRTDDITIVLIAVDRVTNAPSKTTVVRPKSGSPQYKVQEPDSPAGMRPTSMRPVRRRPKKKLMILSSTDGFDDIDDDYVLLPRDAKTAADRASITAAIKSNFLFQNIHASQRDEIIDVMVRVEVTPDELVIRQGDKGDRFYIVERGRYEVRVKAEEGLMSTPSEPRTTDSRFGKYGPWRHEYTTQNEMHPCFGELSLMYGKPRGATVIALEAGVLWALDRKDFRKLLLKSMSSRRRLLDNLRRVKILRCLDVSDIQRLADILSEKPVKAGTCIIKEGTPGDNFYMIIEGKCTVTSKSGSTGTSGNNSGSKEALVNKLGEWDYFGEKALLSNDVHTSNVTAATDVKLLYINKKSFDEIFGPLSELIDRDRRQREELARLQVNVPTSMRQLTLQAVVSQGDSFSVLLGSFGGVKLASQSFVVSKVRAAGEAKTLSTALEVARLLRQSKRELSQGFLPPLITVLRDSNALHLLFKASPVCDLASLIKVATAKNAKAGFSEGMIKYIASCVLAAIGLLHSVGVISRGIQPESLYLDAEGRVQLLDHRTCKVGGVDMLSYTLCGATDYLAPEQVSLGGHGKAVDLWALGVLLFEVSTGANPFAQGGEVATFNRISSLGSGSFLAVAVPSAVLPHVKALIMKLVLPDPNARLGMGAAGLSAVKSEALFAGVNWNTLSLDASPLLPLAADMERDVLKDAVGNIADVEGWNDANDESTLNFEVSVDIL